MLNTFFPSIIESTTIHRIAEMPCSEISALREGKPCNIFCVIRSRGTALRGATPCCIGFNVRSATCTDETPLGDSHSACASSTASRCRTPLFILESVDVSIAQSILAERLEDFICKLDILSHILNDRKGVFQKVKHELCAIKFEKLTQIEEGSVLYEELTSARAEKDSPQILNESGAIFFSKEETKRKARLTFYTTC